MNSIAVPDEALLMSPSNTAFDRGNNTPNNFNKPFKPSIDRRRLSINTLLTNNERLERALEFEEIESQKLEKTLQECRIRLSNALTLHSQMEDDLIKRDNEISSLQKEVKEAKRAKNEAESSLSQEVMNYINEKQQWLEKEDEYRVKVEDLNSLNKSLNEKLEVARLDVENTKITTSGRPLATTAAAAATNPTPIPHISDSSANKFIERLKSEFDMEKQQMEMVSREYAARFDKVKKEMEQIRSLNNRLIEENEGFQLLLAEKTILGGFSLADELDRENSEDEEASEEEEKVRDLDIVEQRRSSSDSLTAFDDINENNETKEIESDGAEEIIEDKVKDNDSTSTTANSNAANAANTDKTTNTNPIPTKRQLYQLQFENTSLHNHNNALKLSLERLVHRLLEYKEFEKVVEDHKVLNKRSISSFQDRVVSSSSYTNNNSHIGSLDIPKQRATSTSVNNVTTRGHSFTSSISSSLHSVIGRNKPSPTTSSRPSQHSHSSSNPLFQMNPPTTPSGVAPRQYRGALKPSSTWSSMLFSATPNRDARQFSSTSTGTGESTMPGSPSSTSSLVSTSSAASISSGSTTSFSTIDPTALPMTDENIRMLVDSEGRNKVRSIKSQKQLRPLRLLVPPTDSNMTPPPLPSASSQSSGWFSS